MKRPTHEDADLEPAGASQRPRRRRLSLAAALLLGFGGLMLIALGSVSWVTLKLATDNTKELVLARTEQSLEDLEWRIRRHLKPAENIVDFTAAQVARGSLNLEDETATEDFLRGVFAGAPQIRGAALLLGSGRTLAIANYSDRLEVLGGGWQEQTESAAALGAGRLPESSSRYLVTWVKALRQPHVVVQAPLRGDGETLGVVVAVVSISALSEFVSELSDDPEVGIFVLHGRDSVLAHPSLAGGVRGVSESKPLPKLGEVQDAVLADIWLPDGYEMNWLLAGSDLDGREVETSQGERIFVYREFQGPTQTPWIVGVHLPASDARVPFRRLIDAAFVSLGILIAAMGLAIVFGRAVSRPVQRIARAARAIGRLDLAAAPLLPGSPFKELDQAANAYNAMLGGLRLFETYVPRSLVMRLMLSGEAATRSEERPVTVLFTDIVGFTTVCEKLDATQVADFLNRHFGLLAGCIEAEGGTVDKYIGDSVMAFWGAPDDQPDQAERACRAAVAIAQAVYLENKQRGRAGRPRVRLRIGIQSGSVLVGNIGAPGRINYTLVGDAVNVAQRLESLGHELGEERQDCKILISGSTAAQLGSEFQLSDLGQHTIRGRAGQLDILQLLEYEPGEDQAAR